MNLSPSAVSFGRGRAREGGALWSNSAMLFSERSCQLSEGRRACHEVRGSRRDAGSAVDSAGDSSVRIRGSDGGRLPARIRDARGNARRRIRLTGWNVIRTPSRTATGTPSAGWTSTRATWRNTGGRTPRGWLATTRGAKSGVKWRHRPAPIYKSRYLRNPLSQKHLRPI